MHIYEFTTQGTCYRHLFYRLFYVSSAVTITRRIGSKAQRMVYVDQLLLEGEESEDNRFPLLVPHRLRGHSSAKRLRP